KIDGLAISLTYENGLLSKAVTRGDGLIGEDVTNNVKTIKSIPLMLPQPLNITIRGEVYLKRSEFTKLNQRQDKAGLPLFANARNAAAGSLRQLDSKICASRNLDAFVYTIANYQELNLTSQAQALSLLKELGFSVNDQIVVITSIEQALPAINKIESNRSINDYDIDGSVIKINDFNIQEQLGYTTKYPKFAIAFKFNAMQVKTILKKVVYTVGRTGNITPNAVFKPVLVDGSTISKASLHNFKNIEDKDIRINDTIIIHKAGDIIPEVVSVDLSQRDKDSKPLEMITHCPKCQTLLEQVNESVDYFCLNPHCPAKNIESIIHYASRQACNINGLGQRIIEELYEDGIISSIKDIYLLQDKAALIMNRDGFGEKSFENLINGINQSKEAGLDKVLFGLGIRHLGAKSAKTLALKYPDIDLIIDLTYEELIQVSDFGPSIVTSIIEYFKQPDNLELIDFLKEQQVKLTMDLHTENTQDNFFKDKIFVITGTLEQYKRNELAQLLETYGAIINNSISKKTDYLICGTNAGSKKTKALNLGISIIEEEQLLKLISEVTK
ncbi:MAG: NAD-dependent DNA ligase LigA, partial [Bacilli bacterium]